MNLKGRNLLSMADISDDEISGLVSDARNIKGNKEIPDLKGKSLGMIFEKPSLRTRVSFTVAMNQMGGSCIDLGKEIGIGSREPFEDVVRVLDRYFDALAMRTYSQERLNELAGIANIPVINGLTDYNHPCQIMSDFFTIWENKGSLEDLKICYMGDGNNIVNSWLQLTQKFPINFVCACPAGYEPDKSTLEMSIDAGLSKITITNDPFDSIQNSDVIYTDVWASMGQKDEAEIREKVFKPFQVNKSIMSEAGKNAVFMHCLPAERDREVTDEVMEAEYSIVFEQAENRLHIQNAIMATLLNQTIV